MIGNVHHQNTPKNTPDVQGNKGERHPPGIVAGSTDTEARPIRASLASAEPELAIESQGKALPMHSSTYKGLVDQVQQQVDAIETLAASLAEGMRAGVVDPDHMHLLFANQAAAIRTALDRLGTLKPAA